MNLIQMFCHMRWDLIALFFGIAMLFSFGIHNSTYAAHDPDQPQYHSIVLPPDMKGKSFDEFMEWCVPKLGDKCDALYEKNFVSSLPSPLKQSKSGISIMDVTCRDGFTIGYKKDLSKAICTTPETIYKLEKRGWIISPTHSHHDPSIYTNDVAALCNSSDDVLVSYGYSKRDDNVQAKIVSYERIQYDGHAGALLTFDREFDGGMARGANNGYFPYIHCVNESVDTFEGCMNVSHHFSDSNYPILECLTLDGKKFSFDEAVAMSQNSGIEIYTINHLNSVSLEFVGKTDRVDKVISFTIIAPNGNEISTWDEFAPDEGEFKIAVTTGGPLWKQQDGVFTLIAKQTDLPYYEAFSEFELADGRIVR